MLRTLILPVVCLTLVAGAPAPLQTFTHTVHVTSNIGRVGVNYKF